MNRERLLELLANLVSSLGLSLGNLERSLLEELYLDLDRLEDLDLKDLLDLDLPLGRSLPPKPDRWRLVLDGDLETEEGIVIRGFLIIENKQKGI